MSDVENAIIPRSPGNGELAAPWQDAAFAAAPPHGHGPNILHTLWRRKLMVLVALLWSAAGAAAYLRFATPIYSSSSSIRVQQGGIRVMAGAGDPLEGRQSGNYLNTECRVIVSGRVLGAALQDPRIRDLPSLVGGISDLAQNLKVTPGKTDDLITVSYESPRKEETEQVVNAVVDAYIYEQSERRKNNAKSIQDLLAREKTTRETELKTANDELDRFREKHPEMGFQTDKANIIVQRLDRLSSALTAAELEVMDAKARYDAVRALVGNGTSPTRPSESNVALQASAQDANVASPVSPSDANAAGHVLVGDANDVGAALVIDANDAEKINRYFEEKRALAGMYIPPPEDQEISLLRAELRSLEDQKKALEDQKKTVPYARGSEMRDKSEKKIDERIADVTTSITHAKESIAVRQSALATSRLALAASRLNAARQEYNAAVGKLKAVAANYGEQLQQATKLNSVLTEHSRLQNRRDGLKKIVEGLESRISDLEPEVRQSVGNLVITVLDKAFRSEQPIRPNHAQVYGIALALGVLLGVGLALLRNWMDPRVTSAEEIGALLGTPVVGTLPRVRGKRNVARLGRNVLDDPLSGTAEAFRGIRTTLGFGLRGAGAKTVLVTSPAPRDGKSTVVSNLAICMSLAGRKVLVLDADLRKPQQHSIFSVSNEVGLAEVLAGKVPVAGAIQHFDSSGVDILTSGRIERHSHEMLSRSVLADLLGHLTQTYDLILIDSPPLMSVTDPLVLATLCDVTVLVMRAGSSHRDAAERARECLMGVGARVVGAVVTGVKGNGGRYYPYYYTEQQSGSEPHANGSEAAVKT